MKKFKQYIKEMDLSREPSAIDDVEDRTGTRPNFKAGDRWASGMRKTTTVTKKEADDINSGKVGGGSPFPDSWGKKNTEVAKNNLPKPSVPVEVPKKIDRETTTAAATEKQSGMANPEWIKKHSWIKDAVKQERLKKQ